MRKLMFGMAMASLVGWIFSKLVRQTRVVRVAKAHKEDLLDDALLETFPASDPVSVY
ncbi:MAG: hypothetical protein JSS66_03115 [Armatimonadetes bacterium]|nr:hypothetical protein [Armatimonadota bacterium]